MKPNWLDMLVYRLYYWRWNKIYATNPAYREFFISWMKAYDVVDNGEKVKVTIERIKT